MFISAFSFKIAKRFFHTSFSEILFETLNGLAVSTKSNEEFEKSLSRVVRSPLLGIYTVSADKF